MSDNVPGDQVMREALAEVEGPRRRAEGRSQAGQRSKRWMCTMNNPGDYTPVWNANEMDYMVWQSEVGHETHTPHFHCYIRFKVRKTRAAVKRFFGGHELDIRAARGTEAECKAYCTKPDTRYAPGAEYGEFLPEAGAVGQGERSDLLPVATKCKAGVSLRTIAEDHSETFVKFHSGIAALHALVAPLPPAIRQVQVLLLWGATGTGKSYRVATQMPEAYKVRPGRDPWGNYRGEDTVWFDEFNWEKWTIFEMNEYLDQYRCKLDRRYTDAYAAWTRVVICANSNPTSWYTTASQDEVNAFRRRLGGGCRLVTNRYEDISLLPPNPDFTYLIPPPMAAAADPTQLQTQ